MSDRPYFSIGVTTFNRRELLIETLMSILAQSFVDFEVIVGNDNPSQLVTLDMLGIDDPRVRILNHTVNLGEIGNMNELLAESQGIFFTWLADDDIYNPDFLQAVRDAHEQWGAVNCVFTSYANGSDYNSAKVAYDDKIRQISGKDFLRDYLARKILTLGCYGIFETRYLRSIGGMVQLGSGFSPYSDNLLAIKAGLLESLCYIDAPLLFFRTHLGSISFTSPDIGAYVSAQDALCQVAVEVLRAKQLRPDLRQNLFNLLGRWCITDAFHVLCRSEPHRVPELIWSHMRSFNQYSSGLGIKRFQLVWLVMVLLFRYWSSTPRRHARRWLSGRT